VRVCASIKVRERVEDSGGVRESVRVCVCERESESVCVSIKVRERVGDSGGVRESVRVCVCERE